MVQQQRQQLTAIPAPRELAENRSRTYWFLAGLYLSNPDAGVLDELRGQLAAMTFPEASALAEAVDALRGSLARIDEERLLVEYARLLRGLHEGYGPPPPYESLYREGRLMGDATLAVVRRYAEAGFGEIHPEAGPQDHLGAELKFMALLCHEESRAWAEENPSAGFAIREQEAAFLGDHLLRWVPDYCRRLEHEAREPFYAAAAELTARALAEDSDLLEWLREGGQQ